MDDIDKDSSGVGAAARHVVGVSSSARPFLKWPGGKRQLLKEIGRFVPAAFGRYHEPFIGGGALFFELEHADSVISDANAKLIATYDAVRTDVEGVIDELHKLENTERCYYKVRSRNFSVGTSSQRAAEFIYANRVGFNGMFRENRRGQFNVPFGDNPNATICDEDNLRAVAGALLGATVLHGDFAGVLDRAGPGDFVYCDPPYVPVSTTSSFTGYQAGGFGHADQVRLRDVALELKRRRVHVLLSNSASPVVFELYAGFDIQIVDARRAINCKAERRGLVKEVLIR